VSFWPTSARPLTRFGWGRAKPFSRSSGARINFSIRGVTCAAAGGAPLAGCRVDLFALGSTRQILTTVSDGSGNFRFDTNATGPFFLRAYLSGSPDVAGVSVSNLMAT
jgi:hypothetical protein